MRVTPLAQGAVHIELTPDDTEPIINSLFRWVALQEACVDSSIFSRRRWRLARARDEERERLYALGLYIVNASNRTPPPAREREGEP